MRAFLFAFAFASTSALACPQLAGVYKTCRSESGDSNVSDVVISQSIQNKITTYTIQTTNLNTNETEEEVYKADGKVRTETIEDPDLGVVIQAATKVTCTNSALTINVDMKFNGMKIGSTKAILSKKGNQLLVETRNFDGDEETVEKEICE